MNQGKEACPKLILPFLDRFYQILAVDPLTIAVQKHRFDGSKPEGHRCSIKRSTSPRSTTGISHLVIEVSAVGTIQNPTFGGDCLTHLRCHSWFLCVSKIVGCKLFEKKKNISKVSQSFRPWICKKRSWFSTHWSKRIQTDPSKGWTVTSEQRDKDPTYARGDPKISIHWIWSNHGYNGWKFLLLMGRTPKQPLFGCKKPCKIMGYLRRINWFAGFLPSTVSTDIASLPVGRFFSMVGWGQPLSFSAWPSHRVATQLTVTCHTCFGSNGMVTCGKATWNSFHLKICWVAIPKKNVFFATSPSTSPS